VPIVGGFDKDSFIIPLRRIFARSEDVEKVVGVIGQLDELMSYHIYGHKSVHKTILPKMVVSDNHYIQVTSAVNPVLGFTDEKYVANDFDTSQHNLAFFTGPNSGGKTAFCKTLAQIQLLAQVGCYVPSESAVLTVADRVYYQTPEINSLDQDVGRFGTELKRTRDIFTAATTNSLVILDELAEGTTHKEKLETSLMILEAFKKLGSLTILVTHNHELAEHYMDGKQAVFRQVEFDGERATHRFIEGVSIISHADLVARSVGFSKQDIERILKEKLAAAKAG
jgi:DNA mismatch repair ATPase MutS